MLIGVGIDLADASFWQAALDNPATSVVEGTFTDQERRDARTGAGDEAERLAGRFAAKEAFVKALGGSRLGLPPSVERLDLSEVEVLRDAYGRPSLTLHGRAAEIASNLGVRHTWLSLTHEKGQAAAVVVLEG